jgi:hypothetical protein
MLIMSTQYLPNDSKLMGRALAAWYRSGATDIPSELSSDRCVIDGKYYVTLRNVNGVLACYRETNQGQLKRLKRLPKGIVE